MRAVIASLALLGGCTRDPTFFGYWEIYEAERAGVTATDVGFFEIDDAAQVSVFLRYAWTGQFVPEAHPVVTLGTTDASTLEILGSYKTKGETYTLTLEPFAATFDVESYLADQAVLSAPAAAWPPGTDLAETTLYIRR